MKYENATCECGFDLSSAKPEVYDEAYPGVYMGHCPSCLGAAQPVVEEEPEVESPAATEPEVETPAVDPEAETPNP